MLSSLYTELSPAWGYKKDPARSKGTDSTEGALFTYIIGEAPLSIAAGLEAVNAFRFTLDGLAGVALCLIAVC